MPRMNRSLSMPLDEIGVYHCYSRCVQQAYLCGYDPDKKVDFSYRKGWIREKLRRLAKAFSIDIWKYALMSTHLHVILRNRPDVSRHWTDQEIARRWWEVCPGRLVDGLPAEPKQVELNLWLSDPEFMRELRSRIADPSWLMRELLVNIARKANKETNKEGKFWDHRFGSRRLLDEAAILACALYVDLNVVRAEQAESLDTSEFTSIHDQIQGRKQRLARAQEHNLLVPPDGGLLLDTALIAPEDADSWLGASTLEPRRRIETLDNRWLDEFGEIVWEEFTWSDDESGEEPDATIGSVLEMNFTPQELAELGLPADVSELATAALADLGAAMNAVADETTTNSADVTEPAEGESFAASTSESDAPENDAALSEPEIDAMSQAMSESSERNCTERDKTCGGARKRCRTDDSGCPESAKSQARQDVGWWDDPAVPKPEKRPRPRRAMPMTEAQAAEEALLGKKRVIRLSESARFPAPRASNKGFTSLTFDEYLELAEWVGRQVRRGKRGVIQRSSPVGPSNDDARLDVETRGNSDSAVVMAESRATDYGAVTTAVHLRPQDSQELEVSHSPPPREPPCDEEEEQAPETLRRVGIDGHGLLDLMSKMGDHFGIAVGRLENMLAEAKRVGRNWLWRQKLMARVFT